MGGPKKWLDSHIKFCFSKFTDSAEDEDGKWCIVGADSDGNHALVVPNATRGGREPVKLWYDEARIEDAKLFSTINLQCFRANVWNMAKKWYNGANNPVNGSNPPRTTDLHDTTQDQEDNKNGSDDVPVVPGDIPQAANEDNISFVRETILLYNAKAMRRRSTMFKQSIQQAQRLAPAITDQRKNAMLSFTLPLAESSPTRTLQASAPLVSMVLSLF
jgi:hypothetical protein